MTHLTSDDEISVLTRDALAALPISWTELKLQDRYHRHNPDFFDCVLELFSSKDQRFVTDQDQAQNRQIRQASAPHGTVLSDLDFARNYDRPTHRVMWVLVPLLSRDRNRGLVVVQIEEATPSGAMAVDHWVLMERDDSGAWHRQPIPAFLRARLYLTDETGG